MLNKIQEWIAKRLEVQPEDCWQCREEQKMEAERQYNIRVGRELPVIGNPSPVFGARYCPKHKR